MKESAGIAGSFEMLILFSIPSDSISLSSNGSVCNIREYSPHLLVAKTVLKHFYVYIEVSIFFNVF